MEIQAERDSTPVFLTSERLASLSDGMFGVAMTLLATTLILPVQALVGSPLEMLHEIGGAFSGVVLSFAISGTYWLSQQHRLTMARVVTPLQTVLNFSFLFLIVLLPLSTALYGRGIATKSVVIIYGAHLALLGLANVCLWLAVNRNPVARERIVGASLTLVSFIAALAIAAVRPDFAKFFWYAGFAMPWLGRRLMRKR